MAEATPQTGLLAQLRQRIDVGLSLLQVRLALLGTELEIEKQRLLAGFFWGAAALISLTLALVMFSALVILLLWDGYRLAALALLVAFFLAGATGLLQVARARLAGGSNLFRASLAELDRDRAALAPTTPPP
ncbi:MAG: phage holin family protein [Rhodoferax sp.]